MATPLYDAISVSLSQRIGDPVAAAATDGVKWSSAQRDTFINGACRRWLTRQVRMLASQAVGVEEALQSYVVEETVSLSGGTYALSTLASGVGAIYVMSAYNSTDNAIIKPLPAWMRPVIQSSANTLLSDQYWLIDGGNIRVVGTDVAGTESIIIKFVKNHPALAANGSAGTVVSDVAWNATGTAVTNFTGTVATHVGATFAGLDSGGNPFNRIITAYVSATAFTINTALVADGAGTNGYIIPPASGEIIVPSTHWGIILDLATVHALEADPSNQNLAWAVQLQNRVDKELNGA